MDGTSTLNYKTVEMGGFAEEPDLTNVSLGDADAAILQEAEQGLQQSDTELESNRESLQGLRDESALPNAPSESDPFQQESGAEDSTLDSTTSATMKSLLKSYHPVQPPTPQAKATLTKHIPLVIPSTLPSDLAPAKPVQPCIPYSVVPLHRKSVEASDAHLSIPSTPLQLPVSPRKRESIPSVINFEDSPSLQPLPEVTATGTLIAQGTGTLKTKKEEAVGGALEPLPMPAPQAMTPKKLTRLLSHNEFLNSRLPSAPAKVEKEEASGVLTFDFASEKPKRKVPLGVRNRFAKYKEAFEPKPDESVEEPNHFLPGANDHRESLERECEEYLCQEHEEAPEDDLSMGLPAVYRPEDAFGVSQEPGVSQSPVMSPVVSQSPVMSPVVSQSPVMSPVVSQSPAEVPSPVMLPAEDPAPLPQSPLSEQPSPQPEAESASPVVPQQYDQQPFMPPQPSAEAPASPQQPAQPAQPKPPVPEPLGAPSTPVEETHDTLSQLHSAMSRYHSMNDSSDEAPRPSLLPSLDAKHENDVLQRIKERMQKGSQSQQPPQPQPSPLQPAQPSQPQTTQPQHIPSPPLDTAQPIMGVASLGADSAFAATIRSRIDKEEKRYSLSDLIAERAKASHEGKEKYKAKYKVLENQFNELNDEKVVVT